MFKWICFFCLLTGMAYSNEVDLSRYEKKIFSQNGEDGVIEKLMELVGNDSKYYVEFGTGDGSENNTRVLREIHGWKGLLMDGRFENESINLRKEFITAENINDLFEKYGVPTNLDLLSIDIDYNDFYVWKAIDEKYQPRVIVIEYNASHPPEKDCIVIYDPNGWWDHSRYFGASILSMYKLGRKKGYSLVYADKKGINLFFVRDDLLECGDFVIKNVNDVEKIYRSPKYGRHKNGHHHDAHHRLFTTFDEVYTSS